MTLDSCENKKFIITKDVREVIKKTWQFLIHRSTVYFFNRQNVLGGSSRHVPSIAPKKILHFAHLYFVTETVFVSGPPKTKTPCMFIAFICYVRDISDTLRQFYGNYDKLPKYHLQTISIVQCNKSISRK